MAYGFTEKAIKKRPHLVTANQNRARSVWDKPVARLPNAVMAFFASVSPGTRSSGFFTEIGQTAQVIFSTFFVTVETRPPQGFSGMSNNLMC
jgi:hypothetical protein